MNHSRRYLAVRTVVRAAFWLSTAALLIGIGSLDSTLLH